MKKTLVIIALFCMVFSASFAISEETNTTLSIEDSPPYVIRDIPDIFLIVNQDAINYLDLMSYFGEDNGDELTITYSAVENITITISSDYMVSFYPAEGYIGTQSVRFTVSDAAGSAVGNWFELTVGEDTIPPQWFNPQKNRANVYQNSAVNFTTYWTDNVDLESFILSIKQSDEQGWINLSRKYFSGKSNISNDQVTISASPLTSVYWRVYARDSSGNVNATDIQTFTVKELQATDTTIVDEYDGEVVSGTQNISTEKRTIIDSLIGDRQRSDFKSDTSNIKVSLRQGDTTTKVVKITNTGTTTLELYSSISGLSRYTILQDDMFRLDPGETKNLAIDFKIPDSAIADQYFGYLEVKTTTKTLEVPIVLEITEFDSEIDVEVTVTDEYKNIKPGKPVVANVKLTSIRDTKEMTINLYYAVKDFSGNIVDSAETTTQLFASTELDLNLTIPVGTEEDEYLFYVRATGEDVIDIGSDSFFVGLRFKIFKIIQKFLYLIIFLILLLILIVLYLKHKKNEQRQKALELYIMLNELRDFVKEGKTEDAVQIYKRIKVTYGQHVSKDFQKDKELLKAELDKFAKLLSQNPVKEGDTKDESKPAAAPAKSPEPKPTPAPAAKPVSKPTSPASAKPVVKPAPTKPATPTQAKPKESVVSAVKEAVKAVVQNPPTKPAAAPAKSPEPKPTPAPAAKPVSKPTSPASAKPVVKPAPAKTPEGKK